MRLKRSLAALSAAALLVTALPVQAFAAGIPISYIDLRYDLTTLPKDGWTVEASPANFPLAPGSGYEVSGYSYQYLDKSSKFVNMDIDAVFNSEDKYCIYIELKADGDRYFDIADFNNVRVNNIANDYDFEKIDERTAFLRYPIYPQTTYDIIGEEGAKVSSDGWTGDETCIPLVKGDSFDIEAPEPPSNSTFDHWEEYSEYQGCYVTADSLNDSSSPKSSGICKEGGKKYRPVFLRKIGSVDLKYTIPCGGNIPGPLPSTSNETEARVETGYITDINGNSFMTYEVGKEYVADVIVAADQGYRFSVNEEDNSLLTNFTVNGVSADEIIFNPSQPEQVELKYKFKVEKEAQKLDSVQLRFDTPPKGSDKFSQPLFSSDDGKCNLFGAGFSLDDGSEFAEGQEYSASVYIVPNNGYIFDIDNISKTVSTKVYVNGKEAETRYVEINPAFICVTYKFVFSHKAVDNVSIDLEVPKAGTKGDTQPHMTTAPGSQFDIVKCFYSNDLGSVFDTPMQAGKQYYANIILRPAEGYVFDLSKKFYVNGTEINFIGLVDENKISLLYPFTVEEPIPIGKAELKFTPPSGNGKLENASATAVSPVGYEIVKCGYYDKDGNNAPVYAEKDKDYYIGIEIKPLAGYVFATDTPFTVNGKEPDKIITFGDSLVVTARVYPFGEKKYLLGDVDLNGVIDIEDAVMVIGMVNGNKVLEGQSLAGADCNSDGKVDIEDAVMIIGEVVGNKPIPQDHRE